MQGEPRKTPVRQNVKLEKKAELMAMKWLEWTNRLMAVISQEL